MGGQAIRRRAVILDWNGTQNDMDSILRQDIAVAWEVFGIRRTPDDVKALWGNPAQVVLPALFDQPVDRVDELRQIFWSYDDDPRFARQLHPDVLPTLSTLKAANFILTIVTSGPRDRVLGYMQQAGLPLNDFLFIHTGDEIAADVEAGNPVLARAVRELVEAGVDPSDITMVGDEPNDVHNARAMNLGFVAVRRETSHFSRETLIEAGASPDRVIAGLQELPGILGVEPPPSG